MTNLDNEINRIATFVNWQLHHPSAFNLARAGLAYTGTGDTVFCYKCNCLISDWKENDVPLERHRRCSPNCPFVASLPGYRPSPGYPITRPAEDVSRPQNPVPRSRVYQPSESSSINLTSVPNPMPITKPSDVQKDDINRSSIQTGTHLKLESQRLRTFDSWTNTCVNKIDLAKAGFFFTGIGDCVKCVFCSSILKQWEPHDIPFDEHRKHFPKCPFVLGLNVGNLRDIDLMPSQPTRVMQPQHITKARLGGGGAGGKICSPSADCLPYETRNSLNFDVKFANVEQRLRSYENIPLPKGQDREVLAAAGFHYVGPGDSVKCFQCGGVLKKWSEADEPWTEHAKWFPDCLFLLQQKGYQFINHIQQQFRGSGGFNNIQPVEPRHDISGPTEEVGDEDTLPKERLEEAEQEEMTLLKQEFVPSSISTSKHSAASSSGTVKEQHPEFVTHPSEMPSASSPSPSSSTNPPPQPLKAAGGETARGMATENERLREAIQCKICMDEMANTVFLPCGHLLCCEHCAPAIIDCPVCRGIIKGTLKVYIS